MVSDFVEDDAPDLTAQTCPVGAVKSFERSAVDRDLVRQDAAVSASPSRERNALIEPEQRLSCWWLHFDDNRDIGDDVSKLAREGGDRVLNLPLEVDPTGLFIGVHGHRASVAGARKPASSQAPLSRASPGVFGLAATSVGVKETRKGPGVFNRTKTQALKDSAASATELAAALAKDKKFRKELLSGISHGVIVRRRAARRIGFIAAATRMASDYALMNEVRKMSRNLEKAWGRIGKKQSHKLRNTLLIAGVGGAAAAVAFQRRRLFGMMDGSSMGVDGGTTPRTIDESIEVNVPVSVAYNQWTQFEDFPLFMEGVDHVQQLDDTLLRWAATVAGKTNQWTAKILEQHPDRQISWISEDGKKTRGTVTFEPRSENKTLVRLSMSYQADPLEAVGSAAGLDARRVRGDLERFKELIESRGTEIGAWRGEVSAGQTKK
jgi:uncharacterized membrane protein